MAFSIPKSIIISDKFINSVYVKLHAHVQTLYFLYKDVYPSNHAQRTVEILHSIQNLRNKKWLYMNVTTTQDQYGQNMR